MIHPARILIIDDDPSILATYELILTPRRAPTLRSRGNALFRPHAPLAVPPPPRYQLALHTHPRDGLRAARTASKGKAPFIAAFVDMHLPGMDGIRVIRELDRVDPRIPIAVVTAQAALSRAEITRASGRRLYFITKPFSSRDIRRAAQLLTRQWPRDIPPQECHE